MLERQTSDIPQSTRELCRPSYPLIQGSFSQIKAHVPGLFCSGRCEQRVRGVGSAVVSWLHSVVTHNGATSRPPTGFHFKSQAFVEKCICSLILFGNCVKQKRTTGEKNHSFSLSSPTPSQCHLSPSLSITASTSLHHSSCAYFAEDANDLSPLYSDARSVYTFPFHPHTNVLLLPLRPRAF